MLKIKVKSVNCEALKAYLIFLNSILEKKQINYNIINLPKKIKRVTLLKSPHVYKKAREQFQIVKNSKIIYIRNKINNQILKFLIIKKPKIVTLKITY
jgi:small subunit ribosomal protein S10